MKLATYNIWNHQATFEARFGGMCEELIKINADVIALQEVPITLNEPGQLFLEQLAERIGYEYGLFKAYPDDDEGLGFLSRTPLEEVSCKNEVISNCAYRVTSIIDGCTIGITNVHLDWKSALMRENEITAITEWVERDSTHTQFEFLCGDFNSLPYTSSVYNFLMGQQSLAGKDTFWIDLPELYAHAEGQEPPATLDFKNNPWLHNRDQLNEFRKPDRLDWVLLKSLYPKAEPALIHAGIFGVGRGAYDPPPSDHYGVMVEVSLS